MIFVLKLTMCRLKDLSPEALANEENEGKKGIS